jgi:hypothetical protein
MSPTYLDAVTLAFGSRPFSVREFSSRIGANRATRLLNEMKVRGWIERTGRGTYRALPPEERRDMRAHEWTRVNRLLLGSRLPMAWTDADAVRVWTGGRYTVSPSAFLREFHIEIPKEKKGEWIVYLRAHRISTDPRRRVGSKVVLTVPHRFRRTLHRGEPVIPRSATAAMIKAHRGLYGDAEKHLER